MNGHLVSASAQIRFHGRSPFANIVNTSNSSGIVLFSGNTPSGLK